MPKDVEKRKEAPLSGTTLRVYRYLYKSRESQGIHDVQRALNLSSPSVAAYHIKKLVEMGLIKQEEDTSSSTTKYYVDRIIFENMIRFRRSLIPIQIGYLSFFASALLIYLILIRTRGLEISESFSIIVIALACAVFAFETFTTLRKSTI